METQAPGIFQRVTKILLHQGIHFQKVIISAGQEVFSRNDRADSVFFISQGSIEISISGKSITVLFVGDFFGEHCLGQDEYRPNSATALEDTRLVRIEKEEMLRAFHAMPALRVIFVANLIRQMQGLASLLGLELSRDSDQHQQKDESLH